MRKGQQISKCLPHNFNNSNQFSNHKAQYDLVGEMVQNSGKLYSSTFTDILIDIHSRITFAFPNITVHAHDL